MPLGIPPKQISSLDYTGSDIALLPVVESQRDPLTTDTNYPTFTGWRNAAASPVRLWVLVGFTSGQANWRLWAGGATGNVVTLSDTIGTKVNPDGTGNIQLIGGPGISIVAGVNLLTVTANSGLTWNNVTSTGFTQMVAENGYAANSGIGVVGLRLPAPGGTQFGNTIAVMGVGSGGWSVVYGTGQSIVIGNKQTTVTTGSISSTQTGDGIELVCGPDNLTWFTVKGPQGNITIV
jgi:hypothetical protein